MSNKKITLTAIVNRDGHLNGYKLELTQDGKTQTIITESMLEADCIAKAFTNGPLEVK